MTSDVDLKKIRQKVYMTFFQDGIWDIFLGLFLLGWGFSIMYDVAYLPGVWTGGMYFTIWGIKKWLTYPRVGYVRFSETSRQKIKTRFIILLTGVLLLGVIAGLVMGTGNRPDWLSDYFALFFNGMLALIVCIIAYWAGVRRFYFHALLVFLGAVVHQWLDVKWEYGFIGSGGIILVIGLGFLIDFLRRYPKVKREEVNGK